MKNWLIFRVRLAALFLGFFSAFVQYLLLGEFLKVWGDKEWVVGVVLFSWIFLSGTGSYFAVYFEKFKRPLQFMFYGFLLLSCAPFISWLMIHHLESVFALNSHTINYTSLFLSLLIFSPVCLLNGILFSIVSQAFTVKLAISGNYAIESIGTILAGLLAILLFNVKDFTLNALLLSGLLSVGTALLIAFSSMGFIKSVIPGIVAIALLSSLWVLSYENNVNPSHYSPDKNEQSVSFPTNTLSANYSTTISTEESFHKPVFRAQKFGFSNITVTLKGDFFKMFSGLILPFLLIGLFIVYFRKLKTTGRSIFIAGFSCMAMELIVITLFKSSYGGTYKSSGIIFSIFMAGMVLGYRSKLSEKWNRKQSFRKILLLLAFLSSAIFIELSIYNHSLALSLWFILGLIISGFCFSYFTGLLITIGVQLEEGSIGKIVSSTYGADMLGASVGALLVSSFLLPLIGPHIVCLIIGTLLIISALNFSLAK